MKTVFVSIILLIDAATGVPVEVGIAVFDTREMCEFVTNKVRNRAAADVMVDAEAQCVEAAVVSAK